MRRSRKKLKISKPKKRHKKLKTNHRKKFQTNPEVDQGPIVDQKSANQKKMLRPRRNLQEADMKSQKIILVNLIRFCCCDR